MSAVPIASLYAGLAGLLLVVLSALVVRLRVKHQVGIGYGQNAALERAGRVQGNFVEYAPLTLLLLLIDELGGTAPWLLHLIGVLLIGGRIAHAFGLSGSSGSTKPRLFGMMATITALVIAAVTALLRSLGL